MESGIHPCWDVTISEREKNNLWKPGNSQHGWSLLQTSMKVHQQRESCEEMRAHTVHCTAPWLKGRERHNQSILHLLGCETQCVWRWLWGAKLSGMVWKSKPVIRQVIQDIDIAFYSTHFLSANAACQTNLWDKLPRQVSISTGMVRSNIGWQNSP